MARKADRRVKFKVEQARDLEEGGLGDLLRKQLKIKDPVEVIVLTRDDKYSQIFAKDPPVMSTKQAADMDLEIAGVSSIPVISATPPAALEAADAAMASTCTKYCLKYIGGRWIYVCCAWS